MLHPVRIPLTFIDLDHCYNAGTWTIIDPRAQGIVTTLNFYTEVSPSGEGLHVLVYATLPGSGIHTDIEMYDRGRYFTVTTRYLAGTLTTIEKRQAEVTILYRQHQPPGASKEQNTVVVLERSGPPLLALPIQAEADPLLQALLWGDISAFNGDESRADFVLLLKLLHWTGDDLALTKRLFLLSLLGQRTKAREKRGPTTYLDMTIRNVLRKRRNPLMKR